MHQHEPAGTSYFVVRIPVPKSVPWRQHRKLTSIAAALLILSFVWMYRVLVVETPGYYDTSGGGNRLPDEPSRVQPPPQQAPPPPPVTVTVTVTSTSTPATASKSPDRERPNPFTDLSRIIPPKIWQIVLPKEKGDKKPINRDMLKDSTSWLALNPDYTYTLVGEKGGNDFVHEYYGNEPEVVKAYEDLRNVGMKSDLLRYLVLYTEGGVYTDTDTEALKSIDIWVPEQYRNKARLVVGIEFDRRDGGAWADIPHWLQFCQWTIAAAPGHPVFEKMVNRVVRSLKDLSAQHKVPISDLKPGSFDVMNSTGPAAWTDVVFEQLQEYDPSLKDTKDLSFMTEPRLIGDILVLTIDGFGMGQSHSKSTNDGSIPAAALMKHNFHGSWRGD